MRFSRSVETRSGLLGWVLFLLPWVVKVLEWWHLGEFLIKKGQRLHPMMEVGLSIVSAWWFHLAVSMGGLLLIWRSTRVPGGEPARSTISLSAVPATLADDRALPLIATLKRNADDYSEAELSYASNLHRPAIETLKSLFERAGWRVNFNNVALEDYLKGQFFHGTEVWGYNKHVVEVVARALRDAGYPDLRWRTEPCQIARENPKWPWTQSKVYVRLGHPSPRL